MTTSCEPELDAIIHSSESRKTNPPQSEEVEDKRVARKLRNRASALASRNKRTEEIEMLTYRLGKMLIFLNPSITLNISHAYSLSQLQI